MPDPSDNTRVQRGLEDINQAFKERDVEARAKAMAMPYVNLITSPINSDLSALLSRVEAEGAKAALFFKSGKQLRLAVTDPQSATTQELVNRLKASGYEVGLALGSSESINAAHRIYFQEKYKRAEKIENKVEENAMGSFDVEIANLADLKGKIESASADVGLNIIELGSFKARATDIHFQPERGNVLVRFRIDGVLRPIFYLTREAYDGLLKQIKQLAHLKLNVSIIPQDGQYTFTVNQRQINVRVSLLPTRFGEACVMRLLDPGDATLGFTELGYEGEALKHLEQAAGLPHGLILITGPTGSGKTTTLYALLKAIDPKLKKIVTLEDPVEYGLEGITQSQVNPEVGYTFSSGLRAVLRQDPNVIMVGEIRDLETAETAAQASLTGHLVISTLHTNSALESIPRLVNMGVKSFILAPALDLIIAQRLVRRVCTHCVEQRPATAPEQEQIQLTLDQIKAKGIPVAASLTTLRKIVGCTECGQSGYKGQVALAEVLRFNQELRDLLLENKPMPAVYDYINKHCRMLTLHEDGILKVIRGLTTLEEVYRVTV